MQSKGLIFRQLIQEALQTKKPLQIVGAVNAYCGMLAKKTGISLSTVLIVLCLILYYIIFFFFFLAFKFAFYHNFQLTLLLGFKMLYLSGSGVATASYG